MLKEFKLTGCARWLIASCLLAFGSTSQLGFANGFLDMVLSSGYEENLPRGYLDKDIHGSEFSNIAFTLGKLYQPLINTSVIVSGSVGYSTFFNQHGYDNVNAGLGVSVQQKLGMGAYTPRLSLGISVNREDSRGSERDRDLYGIELSFRKRVSRALELSIGFTNDFSRGINEQEVNFDVLPYRPGISRPTDPMDYNNKSVFGAADYTFGNGWLASLSYRKLDGYVVSSAVPPVIELFIYTEAVSLDPAYDRVRLMYLMESEADMWSTSLSIPVGNDTAVDVSYQWQDFAVEYVGSYENSQFLVSLVHQF